jgi:hypothetical protein
LPGGFLTLFQLQRSPARFSLSASLSSIALAEEDGAADEVSVKNNRVWIGERIPGARFALCTHERHCDPLFSLSSLSSVVLLTKEDGGEGWGEEALLLREGEESVRGH